jgi:hypothetical protein
MGLSLVAGRAPALAGLTAPDPAGPGPDAGSEPDDACSRPAEAGPVPGDEPDAPAS